MKTQIILNNNSSLISQTDKTWILNNGKNTNQIATVYDLTPWSGFRKAVLYNQFPYTVLSGPTGSNSHWGTWKCTSINYMSNQCVKYSDLRFYQGIMINYDVTNYDGKEYTVPGAQYNSSGEIESDVTPLYGNPIVYRASYTAKLSSGGMDFIDYDGERLYISMKFAVPYNYNFGHMGYTYDINLFNTTNYEDRLIRIDYDNDSRGTRVHYYNNGREYYKLCEYSNNIKPQIAIELIYYHTELYLVKNGINSDLSDNSSIRLETIDEDTYFKEDLFCFHVQGNEYGDVFPGLEMNKLEVDLITI